MPKTILLADDSSTIRKIVELTFNGTDLRVEACASGQAALERLDQLVPDLVLADVVMPGPNGYEICRLVKESERPVPVVLLSSTFEPYDRELAHECGADGHLVKPFESNTLRDTVRTLLEPAPAQPEAEPEAEAEASPPSESAASDEVRDTPAAVVLGDDLDERLVDAVARAVVRRLSEDVVREIARDLVPELAERLIRERIRELEAEES